VVELDFENNKRLKLKVEIEKSRGGHGLDF